LLSCNRDGFDLVFEFQSLTNKGNRLTICCPLYPEVRLNFVSGLVS